MVDFVIFSPRTYAPVERFFSIMENIWSEERERDRFLVSTVKHLLNIKINSELSSELYDVTKTNHF